MPDQSRALLNPKTIDRLCAYVKVSEEQSLAISKWLALLKTGALDKEKKNYFRFGIIVLKEILGYDIEEHLNFEEGNVEFSFVHPTTKKSVCIEVKGTSTKDLFSNQNREKPEHQTPIRQTWDYMGSGNFDYGIATNYRDFVLIDRTKGYSRYHLFDFMSIQGDISKAREFLAIFSHDSLLGTGILVRLYEESVTEEREFTNEFYKLYHETRLMLIKEFQGGKQVSKEEAIHYAQVFLNRLIFIFFAEDTGKIRKRLFSESILDSLRLTPVSKYSKYACGTIINLFEQLDSGSESPVEIFGFNGGLFREKIDNKIFFNDLKEESFFSDVLQYSTLKNNFKLDEFAQKVLEKFKKTLNPIVKNLLIMASFNFQSELNVNILGHIFEQSLTDLEELQAGEESSKRKKEGIYYTPRYVTEYICRNTIIPYLSRTGTNKLDQLISEYSNDIAELENRFKDIKIVDPACGSGAFLLQAVDILLEIHKEIQLFKESHGQYIVTKKAGRNKKSSPVEFYTLKKWNEPEEARKIIENNIFGVDINEESVEITKLSLFLKIATNNRRLIDLSDNVKVGNSLIDDATVAGAKAFTWKEKFKEIFKSGGFAIVIGNPPYVRVQQLRYNDIDYFKANYSVAHRRIDISMMFFELAAKLVKPHGKIGFISSTQFMTAEYGRNLRKMLLSKQIEKFVDFDSLSVFEDAITYPAIMIFSENPPSPFTYIRVNELHTSLTSDLAAGLEGKTSSMFSKIGVKPSDLTEEVWNFTNSSEVDILSKIKGGQKVLLGSFANPSTGLTTGLDGILLFDENALLSNEIEQGIVIKILRGRNIDPWLIKGPYDYAFYPYRLNSGKTELIAEDELRQNFPHTFKYLLKHKKELLNRKDSRKTVEENKEWYALIRKGQLDLFNKEKIVTPALTKQNSFAIDSERSAYLTGGAGVFGFVQNEMDNRYLIALLNSKVVEYFLHSISTRKQGGYYSYLNTFLTQIPIVKLDKNEQVPYVEKVDRISEITKKLQVQKSKFQHRIMEKFSDVNLSRRLNTFFEMNFPEFIHEIYASSKTRLSLKESDEWEDYFNSHKNEFLQLMRNKDQLLEELDNLVFDLYGLDENERRLVIQKLSTPVNR